METVHLIVECAINDERERHINRLGKVKYKLPMINAYVIEIPKEKVSLLAGMKGIKQIDQTSLITAQMNAARKVIQAEKAHAIGFSGRGVTIAMLDTGISPVDDFTKPRNRILAFKDFVNGKKEAYDDNGHGTHVAGIAAGNGFRSEGKFVGIAPESNIVAVKVLDEGGAGNSADVLAGLQWIIDNKERYNIRVANLSVGTVDVTGRDPLVRAVEAAWDKGIVMTIAAGNNGPGKGTVTSPGISRKVITIGASDDNRQVQIWDDTLENYSGRGPTPHCIIKPDVIAPGGDIVSCLSATLNTAKLKRENAKIVSPYYIKMSGTSMSTPMVAGAVALLLQKDSTLNPDDIKYMLKNAATNLNYPQNHQGWGLINIDKLLGEEAKHVR